MSDRALAKLVYDGLSDAEVVIVALMLNSGAEVAGGPMEAGLAEAMNTRLFGCTQEEMRRRELDPIRLGRGLLTTLIDRIVRAAPEFRASVGESEPKGDADAVDQ